MRREHLTRPLVSSVIWGAVLLAACHPPNVDLPSGEEDSPETILDGIRPVSPRSPEGGAIEHTLRFGQAATHHLEIESVFPTAGAPQLVLFMPVWTPGSYLVREFSRQVEQLSATTLAGEPLDVSKVDKNRWSIDTDGQGSVVVRYRIYARSLSVQESFVDDALVVLNGASVFLCPVGGLDLEHDIAIELGDDYPAIATSLPPHPDGAHRYVARDFDTLVDSPIVAGDGEVRSFDVGGATFELWTFGGGEFWDDDRAAEDVRALVTAQAAFWGVVPFERYLFLNLAENGGGGLEHLESTLMLTSRFSMRREEDYLRWLGLVSHELFHAWNGKRMRPEALGPFDYEREVYTPSLWIVEGLTSYYDDVLLARAGLLTEAQYLQRMGKNVQRLMDTPGRDVQPLSASSRDAWIKYYRHDENSRNSTVSYYNKGALVGFLIDAYIRDETGGQRSLDDVMRLAYERYSGERGYSPEDFRGVIREVLGVTDVRSGDEPGDEEGHGIDALLDAWVEGTDDLPLAEHLEYFGLVFAGETPADEDDEVPGWLGVDVANGEVGRVVREGPAAAAGINVEDEILAIDGYRVRDLSDRLAHYEPGQRVRITLARRERLMDVEATLGQGPDDAAWLLEDADPVTVSARSRRDAWLTSEREVGAPAADDSQNDSQDDSQDDSQATDEAAARDSEPAAAETPRVPSAPVSPAMAPPPVDEPGDDQPAGDDGPE